MTDIVIPYRITNHTKELRYCMRSIETYLTGVGQVFIVGDLPDWIQNVVHIPFADNPDWRYKERNIYEKTQAACNDERVSDPFLFMNDDHYLLGRMAASSTPYLYGNCLTSGKYNDTTLSNTFGVLGSWAFYDIHFPILYSKERYKRAVGRVDWNKHYGYCIKSLYCCYNEIQGARVDDQKLRLPNERPTGTWFSTSDKSFTESIMQELYPNKSKYESEGPAKRE